MVALSALATFVFVGTSSAAPAPKATGDYGYSFGGVQRHVTFNAIQSTTNTCGTFWNVAGNKQFTFRLTGDTTDYTHHVDLTQNGQAIGGSGGYPVSGGDQYHWNITSGSLIGNALSITAVYDLGASGTVMHINGTVGTDGSIAGNWDDNFGGPRTGTFTAPAGTASSLVSYCGKGTFYYDDEQGNWYFGVVKTVSVSNTDAWHAAQIIASSSNLGYESSATNYIYVKVTDTAEPGIDKDVTGGDLMTAAGATSAVAGHLTPSTSAVINAGNIQIH
jgi:hypothetical protein